MDSEVKKQKENLNIKDLAFLNETMQVEKSNVCFGMINVFIIIIRKQFRYLKLPVTQSNFVGPLKFEITRVDCITKRYIIRKEVVLAFVLSLKGEYKWIKDE